MIFDIIISGIVVAAAFLFLMVFLDSTGRM